MTGFGKQLNSRRLDLLSITLIMRIMRIMSIMRTENVPEVDEVGGVLGVGTKEDETQERRHLMPRQTADNK